MKLSDIETGALNAQEWADKGYELPKFDLKAVRAKTHDQPTWIHFGAGNIFRAFPAALLQRVLDAGSMTGASSWLRASTTRSLTRPTGPMTT